MSMEEKITIKYEEIKKEAYEVREKVAHTEEGFNITIRHIKLEAQLELLSKILEVPYEYKTIF